MGTTTLVVEFLIVGFQALVWIGIVASLLWTPNTLAAELLKLPDALAAAVVLAGSYTVGLVVDACSAALEYRCDPFLRRLMEKEVSAGGAPIPSEERRRLRQALRLYVPEITAQLDKDQYLVRLLRSTLLNVVLIFLAWSLFLAVEGVSPARLALEAAGAVALLGTGAAYWRRAVRFSLNRRIFYREAGKYLDAIQKQRFRRPGDGPSGA